MVKLSKGYIPISQEKGLKNDRYINSLAKRGASKIDDLFRDTNLY